MSTKDYTKTNGTSLQGYVKTTYHRLCEVFGEPYEGTDKTIAEWVIEDDDGNVATIYDWKEDTLPLDLYEWHIGGHSSKALKLVKEQLTEAEVYSYRTLIRV